MPRYSLIKTPEEIATKVKERFGKEMFVARDVAHVLGKRDGAVASKYINAMKSLGLIKAVGKTYITDITGTAKRKQLVTVYKITT